MPLNCIIGHSWVMSVNYVFGLFFSTVLLSETERMSGRQTSNNRLQVIEQKQEGGCLQVENLTFKWHVCTHNCTYSHKRIHVYKHMWSLVKVKAGQQTQSLLVQYLYSGLYFQCNIYKLSNPIKKLNSCILIHYGNILSYCKAMF